MMIRLFSRAQGYARLFAARAGDSKHCDARDPRKKKMVVTVSVVRRRQEKERSRGVYARSTRGSSGFGGVQKAHSHL